MLKLSNRALYVFVILHIPHNLWNIHNSYLFFTKMPHVLSPCCRPVPMNGKISVPLYTDGCEGTQYEVRYLEHVQARITLKASRRGDIQIYLTSPMGTRSTLLAKRSQDSSREGFNNWAFMTTHNWGELAKGQWVLVIENAARSCE